VIRGLGPTLGQPPFNLPNALQDPFLDLRDVNGNPMMTNNNWGSASNAAVISSSGYAPPNSLEAAILVTLAPGNYTAILSGMNGTRPSGWSKYPLSSHQAGTTLETFNAQFGKLSRVSRRSRPTHDGLL